MERKTLLMIVNPRAGRSKPRGPLYDAVALFSDAGYLVSVYRTAAAGDAVRVAREQGGSFDMVVAVGGDGTLNEVISGLLPLERHPRLGYIPQGSTNDFAAGLSVSAKPAEAAQAIVAGHPRDLDLGTWNGRVFVYVASFGAFARTSYTASQDVKNAFGHFGYLLEGLKDLDTLRPYRVRITADGETLDGDYLFGAVCNATSVGGLMKLPAEEVALDDGKFELLLLPNPQSAAELSALITALLNQQYDSPGLIFRHISSLHLETETEEELPWALDGEFAPSCPAVDVVNLPRELTIML